MIGLLRGKVVYKKAMSFIVDCQGIGFSITVPFPLAKTIEVNSSVALYVQTVISRDEISLYGFENPEQRDIFNTIIGVRGVGAKAAINILSRLSPSEIIKAIDENQVSLFRTIPGIGEKKSEMIVFNLRKSKQTTEGLPDSHKEIVQALLNLGFNRKEINEKLSKVKDWQNKSVTDVIQDILKQR